MEDLSIYFSSPDPLIVSKTAQKALSILKNVPLYGDSQPVPQNVYHPLVQIHHQASHINFSSPFLPHKDPSTLPKNL